MRWVLVEVVLGLVKCVMVMCDILTQLGHTSLVLSRG